MREIVEPLSRAGHARRARRWVGDDREREIRVHVPLRLVGHIRSVAGE